MRLLLVEDDHMVGNSICTALRIAGFVVDWVRDGRAADLALAHKTHSLLLLDLGLPGKAGMQVLESLRAAGNLIPTLIVTACDAVADRVKALNGGADDYLIKPFDLDELVARIRALLRRQAGRGRTLLTQGELSLDPISHEVSYRGKKISLSAREYAVLHVLMQESGAVLSRAQIEEQLYGWGEEIESNAVEVYIHNLRRKLGADVIVNLRGVGYMIARNG